jgi:hypothetical protein
MMDKDAITPQIKRENPKKKPLARVRMCPDISRICCLFPYSASGKNPSAPQTRESLDH